MRLLMIICIILSCAFITSSFWIHAKAQVGQWLLHNAWQDTLDTRQPKKAWPWADTWPVALMKIPSTNTNMVVLEGVSGEAMAFGPGRITSLSNTAASGVYGIGGHRDSHLKFLQHIAKGDHISLQTADGSLTSFQVVEQFVVDTSSEDMQVSPDEHGLILVTCYPFHAAQTGGPLRYVVIAEPIAKAV